MILDPGSIGQLPAWAQVALVVGATFLQEDLAALAAGTAVMEGKAQLLPMALGVGLGALLANLAFWGAGRLLGTAAFRLPGLRSVERKGGLEKARRQFERSGFLAILVSRFLPGSRIPVCTLAGIMEMSTLRYLVSSLVAILPWTALMLWIPDRIRALLDSGWLWWLLPAVGIAGLLWWRLAPRRSEAMP